MVLRALIALLLLLSPWPCCGCSCSSRRSSRAQQKRSRTSGTAPCRVRRRRDGRGSRQRDLRRECGIQPGSVALGRWIGVFRRFAQPQRESEPERVGSGTDAVGSGTEWRPVSPGPSKPPPSATPIIVTAPPVTAAPSKAIVQTPISGRLNSANGVLNAGGNTQIFITDLVFSNPTGATGSVALEVNGKVLLSLKLDNFRDLDFHFVTPIVVGPGQTMQLRPSCGGLRSVSSVLRLFEPTG